MAKTKRFGFFSETDDGCLNDIHAWKGKLRADKASVLAYLRNGDVVAYSPGLRYDLLSATPKPIGGLTVFCDGVWEWSSDVAYYVEFHDAGLPDDFLDHMAVGPSVTD